ncbi:MAG: hypothetical protein ACE14P_15160 [Methanotrichaceae archaeon]
MGSLSFRIATLSIILLMAVSYGICYIDALVDSTCTMWDNDCCLTELGEARDGAIDAKPGRLSRFRG